MIERVTELKNDRTSNCTNELKKGKTKNWMNE